MELNHQDAHQCQPRSLEPAGTPGSGFDDHSLFNLHLGREDEVHVWVVECLNSPDQEQL